MKRTILSAALRLHPSSATLIHPLHLAAEKKRQGLPWTTNSSLMTQSECERRFHFYFAIRFLDARRRCSAPATGKNRLRDNLPKFHSRSSDEDRTQRGPNRLPPHSLPASFAA